MWVGSPSAAELWLADVNIAPMCSQWAVVPKQEEQWRKHCCSAVLHMPRYNVVSMHWQAACVCLLEIKESKRNIVLRVLKVEQKKQHASVTEAKHSNLEAQLQTEREALERKEKEVVFVDLSHFCTFTNMRSTNCILFLSCAVSNKGIWGICVSKHTFDMSSACLMSVLLIVYCKGRRCVA